MTRQRRVAAPRIWAPDLLWYAKAVHLMRSRPTTDRTSWSYQAAIHGTDARPLRAAWGSCMHGDWRFLPWHRAYLARFEAIVGATVVSLGGPADWSLPYWNYEAPGGASLPKAFRDRTLPANERLHDGTNANPLFANRRSSRVNNGTPLTQLVTQSGGAFSISSAAARSEPRFDDAFTGGFGGTAPGPGAGDGALERTPHGDVHVLVGGRFTDGTRGWMGRFETAGLDPIFWLHHANLDRLWAEWLRVAGHSNPAAAAFSNASFQLFDTAGTSRTIRTSDVLDTVAQLGYTYDTLPVAPPPDELPTRDFGPADDRATPELVGTSSSVARLTGSRAEVQLQLDRVTVERRTSADELEGPSAAVPRRAYLEISDVRGRVAPGVVYGVVFHTGPHDPGRPVGTLSLFGLTTSRRAALSHLHQLRYVYDVTEAVAELRAAGQLADAELRVSFEALDFAEESAPEAADEPVVESADSAGNEPVEESVAGQPSEAIRIGRLALFLN